jgi:chromosome segregation ATPase
MAEKYEIDLELKSNFDKVVKNVDDLKKGMQNVQKETEDIGKSAKNAEKGIKSIGDGFKAVGTTIKALGIGLLLEAFAILKDVFSQNQQVADAFSTAIGALSIAFNDLVKFLIKNIPVVVDFFKDIFENPQKHIEKLGTLSR